MYPLREKHADKHNVKKRHLDNTVPLTDCSSEVIVSHQCVTDVSGPSTAKLNRAFLNVYLQYWVH